MENPSEREAQLLQLFRARNTGHERLIILPYSNNLPEGIGYGQLAAVSETTHRGMGRRFPETCEEAAPASSWSKGRKFKATARIDNF